MKCPECGHEWEHPARRDLKAGLHAIRHPVEALKKGFKKPEYPQDCRRNCNGCDKNDR